MNKQMVSGIDEDGEVMAGSLEEYREELAAITDRELAIEIQSDIPTRQQHAMAVAEYNRRITAHQDDDVDYEARGGGIY